jgi:hypothetical protein
MELLQRCTELVPEKSCMHYGSVPIWECGLHKRWYSNIQAEEIKLQCHTVPCMKLMERKLSMSKASAVASCREAVTLGQLQQWHKAHIDILHLSRSVCRIGIDCICL